jgi:hypothetical protein
MRLICFVFEPDLGHITITPVGYGSKRQQFVAA